MSKTIGERCQIDYVQLGGPFGGTSAANYSKSFSLKGWDKITVACFQNITATGAAAAGSTFQVYVGAATEGPTSFAALSGAAVILGATASTLIEGAEAIYCVAHNSNATGNTLVIDNVTFTFQTNGSVTDKHIAASDSSAQIKTLSCLIGLYCTHLNTSVITTGATNSDMIIERKDLGAGFMSTGITMLATQNATATGFNFTPRRCNGIIEFTAGDVLATNSSYTNFAVNVASSVTVSNYYGAVVIREGAYPATYGKGKSTIVG